jgi:hypothetical protein
MLFVVLPACGDPMLPADFSGPPAAAVKGNVSGTETLGSDAVRPRMSLEWLDDGNLALVGQAASYHRSQKLQTDWDIGLGLPKEIAKFNVSVGARSARIGVAKLVYFDDRDGDEKLDWSCSGPRCDRVLAISSQYVLFVDKPPYCPAFEGATPKARLTTGFHYYSYDNGALRKLTAADPLSFAIIDRAPADIDPTSELQAFADYLALVWRLNLTSGC